MSNSTSFVPALLSTLLTDPGQPRLTWYGANFERIELSGAVLANWVNKTTNLLVEEFDLEPGRTLDLDLPPHWRTLTWALAALRTGATIQLGETGTDELVITHTPASYPDARDIVAVSLAALARKFEGDLPAHAIDAASAVMTYGDALGYVASSDANANALISPTDTVRYEDLAAWTHAGFAPSSQRTALKCHEDTTATRAELIRDALGVWAAGGSVVLLGPGMTAEIADDPARYQRILDSEKITDVHEIGSRSSSAGGR